DGFDLVVGEQDEIALLVLEPLHDLVGIHGADAGHDLLVFDRLAGGLVDLAEGELGAGLGGGIDFDGDRDERKPDLPLPDGPRRGHGATFARDLWSSSKNIRCGVKFPSALDKPRIAPQTWHGTVRERRHGRSPDPRRTRRHAYRP